MLHAHPSEVLGPVPGALLSLDVVIVVHAVLLALDFLPFAGELRKEKESERRTKTGGVVCSAESVRFARQSMLKRN